MPGRRWMLALLAAVAPTPLAHAAPPEVGSIAPDFALRTLDGRAADLAALRKAGPVLLVVLRGYPGYQCPACSAQVAELLGEADALRTAGASVVLVYPGPATELRRRAGEFIRGKTLPETFHLALDPGYTFTNAYGLRWDAPNETAYPATFVIAPDGRVRYAKISRTHGGRARADEVLNALATR